jgi:hypothetical protein
MAKSLFPDEMMKSGELNLETIAAKLAYFHEQLHLIHWQTTNDAEHRTTGALYDYVHDFKDDVIEKLMGYMDKPIKAYKFEPIADGVSSKSVVNSLLVFATNLKSFAEANKYHDISNLADALSGEAAKTKNLLTRS